MPACIRTPWALIFLELLLLTTVQASVIVGCPTSRYMSNGKCYRCPDKCRVCASNTNCSLCQKGFYGSVCETRCGEECTGTCHKFFGHCTYGCPDGEHPREDNGCRLCPSPCSLCESQTKCVMCENGYFGVGCQERCPDNCTACNKTTGQCLECKDSYFMVKGQCSSCPYDCALCVSANTCSQCKDGYFLLDGLCKSCPYGCRNCITAEMCQSCEYGFKGPVHGRCLYKCPSYGVTTYNVPNEDDRCGIWQDTTTNICHLKSGSHSCTSSGNCLQDILCPDSVRCVDETYEQASCATVMHYECKHKCKQILRFYGCETTCTFEARDNGDNNLLCMTDIGSTDANVFQNTTEAYCNQQQVTPTDSTYWPTDRIVLVVCVIVCAITILILIALISQRTCTRGFTKRNKSNVREGLMMIEQTPLHGMVQVDVLSATCPNLVHTTKTCMFTKTVSNNSVDEGFDAGRPQSRSQSFSQDNGH